MCAICQFNTVINHCGTIQLINNTLHLLTNTAGIFEVIPYFDRLIKVLILPQITHEGKDSLNLAGLINQTNRKFTFLFYLHFHTYRFVFLG